MPGLFERINNGVLGRNTWPPPGQGAVFAAIERWAAFRSSDDTRIRQEAGVPWTRRYLLSPVPRMISRAKANLLYGEPPEFRPANDSDADNLERIVGPDGNALDAELHRGAGIASSEREVWGRILVDPTIADVPIIELVSRRQVIPHFRGRFVTGATFFSEWVWSSRQVIRLLEHYEAGVVRAELFKGTPTTLGSQMPLDDFEATKGRAPEVLTGFDYPLCAFIPNAVDGDPTAGYSDYQGLEERFLAINEGATVASENLRLAGRKRALVDAKYLRNGRLPAGDDLFVRQDDATVAGESGKPLQMLEYQFEADQIRTYLDQLIDTTLTFGGAAPQLVGRSVDGGAISGTALKLKMIHSLMESAGTGRYFDRGTARLVRAAQVIDSRPTTQGGFGRRWVEPDAAPTIVRGDGLPRDDQEAAQWLVMAAGAEAISTEEKVRWLHPDWTDDQVEQEVEKIGATSSAPAPTGQPGPIPTPRPEIAPALPADA